MRTVVVGNRELARHVLSYLLESGWNVVGAVAAADETAHKQAGFVPFDKIANRHDIELVSTADINDPAVQSQLSDLNPDLCICPGWHQIIDESVLSIPDRGFIGFHASDLPQGRGGAPVNWSIIHGTDQITLSLFYYSPGVDAGDIIYKESVGIANRDDVDTILDKLSLSACDILDTTRSAFEDDSITTFTQSLTEATYRPQRKPQDGIVDWGQSAIEIRDWIRAQTDPYPGAYTFHDGNRLTIWSGDIVKDAIDDAKPGTVVSIVDREGLDVATGTGVFRLKRVQRDDGPRMWADNFAERYDVIPGMSLGRTHAPGSWIYTGIRDRTGETDFETASNLTVDEQGTITAIVASADRHSLQIKATFDDTVVHSEHVVVSSHGKEIIPISYKPVSTGTKPLHVEFFDNEERIDSRYLRVFVSL